VAPSVQRRKVWLMPTTRVPRSNAANMRKPLKFAGVAKLANRSQPLVGRSSPYNEDRWMRYRRLTSFFPIVDTCLSCEDTARQICAMVPKWRFFASCISSEPRAAHCDISDMHSKFVLRPHTMCGSMVDIQSPIEITGKNIMVCPIT